MKKPRGWIRLECETPFRTTFNRGNGRTGIDLAGTLPPNSDIMSDHHATIYSIYHRTVLQTIIVRLVVDDEC